MQKILPKVSPERPGDGAGDLEPPTKASDVAFTSVGTPMKHFFSTGLETSSGPQISARAAQARIRKMIESESSLTPISDSQLAAQLEREGISIARRTVAKYREQMNIPPVAQRRSVI